MACVWLVLLPGLPGWWILSILRLLRSGQATDYKPSPGKARWTTAPEQATKGVRTELRRAERRSGTYSRGRTFQAQAASAMESREAPIQK